LLRIKTNQWLCDRRRVPCGPGNCGRNICPGRSLDNRIDKKRGSANTFGGIIVYGLFIIYRKQGQLSSIYILNYGIL
jgi:hypothetical protein